MLDTTTNMPQKYTTINIIQVFNLHCSSIIFLNVPLFSIVLFITFVPVFCHNIAIQCLMIAFGFLLECI